MINILIALLLGFLCFSQTSVIKAAAGDLDTTFNGTGKLRTVVGGGEDTANAIVRQTDGKLVVAGRSDDSTGVNFALVRYNTNGTLDATFGTGGKVLTLVVGGVTALAVQPDGKIVAAGNRDNGANTDFALVRYNANGTIDTTFGVNGIVFTDFGGNYDVVNALAIQTSGTNVVSIVVAGSSFTNVGENVAIARYNANGTLDNSFDSDGKLTSSIAYRANAVGLQSGKIVVTGDGCNGNCGVLLRFNTNGALDTTFGGTSGVTLTDGSSNTTISARSLAFYAVFAGEDKIVVTGDTKTPGSSLGAGITSVRLWSRDANTGAPDTTFGTGGLVKLSDGSGTGKSVKISFNNGVANRFVVGTDKNGFGAYVLTLAGALDTSFDGDGFASASIGNNDSGSALLVQPDNRIVVVGLTRQSIVSIAALGSTTIIYSDGDFGLIRFNSNGTLDTTFDGDGKKADDVGNKNAVAKSTLVQSDGKIVVAGGIAVTRFNADGTLDTAFDADGKTKIPFGTITGAAIQSDGKIVVTAASSVSLLNQPPPFIVYRFTANGTLDTSFDTDGMAAAVFANSYASANAVGIQPDGGIVVAGYVLNINNSNEDFAAARFLPNGALDTSFDNDGLITTAIGTGNDVGNAMAIQTDGRIIVAGSAVFGSTTDFALIRYNPDGSLDTTFSFDGKQTTPIGTGNDVANALTIQPNGKIIAAGYAAITSGNNDFAVVRYNADGSLDTTFDGDGKLTTPIGSFNDVGNAVAIQTDGKILVAGSTESASNVNDFAVVRYNTDGSLDNLYGSGGKVVVDVSGSNDLGNAAALDSSGKTIIAGGANNLFGVVRLLGDAPLSQTYEGDVQSRPLGDGFVDSDDIQQIRRFSVGNNLPYQSNEFQRADCSPRSTSGDGFVDGDDVQQARRFSVGTDGNQIAGGPTSIPPPADSDWFGETLALPFGKQTTRTKDGVTAAPAAFRVDNQNTSAGATIVVPIRVDTVGNEAGYTFSIAFDSTKLTNPTVMIGNGGGDVIFNANNPGAIGFSVTSFSGGTIAAGNNIALVNVTFTAAAGATGTTPITFTDTPARRKASGTDPNNPITQPTYTGGTITISGATAAGAAVSGRVLTADGRGIRNVLVTMTNTDGETRTVNSSAFGYFRFADVPAGQTYIISAAAKRYKFDQSSRVLNLTADIDDVNFIAVGK